ncbi:barnase inhibitor [Fusobacterium necrophorum]|uniref:Barnase inhibitor n=1 Tax=Fusobacterium necrophorum BL TaxID=1441732 RepID=A0AB73BZ19_9FUSO|nr:barstar family protein [Fusobacterium necrophorum]AYZ73343.1 barnase inhibitor [Fusobacterium necrophorum]AZW08659.1 barnase inhibitor [Fusobacterium necrophorum subsp. necrophorum]KDE64605.1 barnase inhibitor [Fusobacterium necrophorum BL]SDB21367.1 Barstar (barnase inhibitor) [Fusobacterium necrophorum]SQD09600.1 Barstar (barnase inhibitor) [Fusobacterium necrophorum subsp. necrophorum]
MKYIRIICLYLKKYISDKQFENIFYQDIDGFKNILEEDIYWNILSSNFNKKEDIISINTYLYNYVLKNYKLIYDEISDAYIENLIKSNENNIVIGILKKRYEQKKEVLINCYEINNKLELIYSIKKALNFPQHCGSNWNAIEDFIYDIILPKKIILYNWNNIKEKLPQDAIILTRILDKINPIYCTILYD